MNKNQRDLVANAFPELAVQMKQQDTNDLLMQVFSGLAKISKGEKGDPGYTPIKGIDYTDGKDADEEVIFLKLLAMIPDPIAGKDGISPDADEIYRRVLRAIPTPTDGKDGKNGSPDTAEDIVAKLNTLEGVIDVKVFKGFSDVFSTYEKRLGSIEKSNTLNPKGPIDQRWKGGGLTTVSHDGTLTGNGTPSSPLSVVGVTGTAVWGENLTATGTVFVLAHVPTAGTVRLYRGGARQQAGVGGDYTIVSDTITFNVALVTGEILLADYSY